MMSVYEREMRSVREIPRDEEERKRNFILKLRVSNLNFLKILVSQFFYDEYVVVIIIILWYVRQANIFY